MIVDSAMPPDFRLRQSTPCFIVCREAFGKRDCTSALKSYEAAAPLATAANLADRAGLIYRRIGICKGRLGEIEGSLAAYQTGMAVSETAKDTEILTENVHGAGLALQRLGRLEEALPLAEREYALSQKCGHPEHLVRAMWLLASLYDRTGKRRVAMQMFQQALDTSRKNKDREATIILLDNLAVRYAQTGDLDSGVRLEKEAIALGKPDDPATARSGYVNLGEMQMLRKDYGTARETFGQVLRLANGPEAWGVRVGATRNLADIHVHYHEYGEAIQMLDQTLQLVRELKRAEWESDIQVDRAEVLLAMGRLAEAETTAAEALRIAREIGSPELVYGGLTARGRVNGAQGLHAAAGADFEEAVATAEALRAEGLGDQQALRGAFLKKLPAYQLLVNEWIAQRKPAQALRIAEQAKARVLTDLLLDGAVDERKVMSTDELTHQKQLLTRLAVLNKTAAKNPNTDAKHNADEARLEEERFRSDIFTRHPELHLQSGEFEVVGEGRLAALLPNDRTALLDYFQTADDRIALFVVRRGQQGGDPRIEAFSLSVPGIDTDARRFRQQLANRDLAYAATAKRLYGQLLAPALAALKGIDTLIISPDGPLWEIPFQALMDGAGRHVIETLRISVTPSLTALYETHQRRRHTWKFDLFALGDPAQGSVALPDAAREVEEIRARYSARASITRTGAAASADEFRRNAPLARVIHIAAHADLNNGDPLYSSLNLATGAGSGDDGMLTAREIMSMRLTAELVILSACETALGEARPGEGMMGMGWALSAAGASSAVLSQWKVDSASTKDFMLALHQRLVTHRGTESRAESLRLAALESMRMPGRRHPFYWAAFTLWGDAY